MPEQSRLVLEGNTCGSQPRSIRVAQIMNAHGRKPHFAPSLLPRGSGTWSSRSISTIFAQETAEAAHAQWRVVVEQLRSRFPKLADVMELAEYDVLAFMDFPREHRTKIHSTNTIERLNGEIKRRSDVVGIFPNEKAITRLAGALLLEQNDEYAIQKRYISLESLAPMSDNIRRSACRRSRRWPERGNQRKARRHASTSTPRRGTRPGYECHQGWIH